MPILIIGVEDLDDGQMARIKSIWEAVKQIAPRSARRAYQAYTDDDFTTFVKSIFQDSWNNLRRPIQAVWKPKKQDMNGIAVGHWNKDVAKKTDGAIPAGKRKGADALCRPKIIGDTVVFKVVDKHGALHTFKDVTWDDGDRLTGETKAQICMHYDRNEFSHVTAFNLQVARTHIQHHLWMLNDPTAVSSADALPQFKEMSLCLPLWSTMYQDARVVRKKMQEMQKGRNYLSFRKERFCAECTQGRNLGWYGGRFEEWVFWGMHYGVRRLDHDVFSGGVTQKSRVTFILNQT